MKGVMMSLARQQQHRPCQPQAIRSATPVENRVRDLAQ
jgi:hypothetical protein